MPAPSKITRGTTYFGDNTRGVIWPVFTVLGLATEDPKALIKTTEMALGLGRSLPVSVGFTHIGSGDSKEGLSNEDTTRIQDALYAALENMKPGSTKDNSLSVRQRDPHNP
jgi:hypothetical protein